MKASKAKATQGARTLYVAGKNQNMCPSVYKYATHVNSLSILRAGVRAEDTTPPVSFPSFRTVCHYLGIAVMVVGPYFVWGV